MTKIMAYALEALIGIVFGILVFVLFFVVTNNNYDLFTRLFSPQYRDFVLNSIYFVCNFGISIFVFIKTDYRLSPVIYFVVSSAVFLFVNWSIRSIGSI